MSKSKRGAWGSPFEFTDGEGHLDDWEAELPAPVVEEAHEALSKLYQKAHKRKPGAKTLRKTEGWH